MLLTNAIYRPAMPMPKGVQCLPMAFVPDPGVASQLGPEVGTADVVDEGGEAQQAAVAVGPVGPGRRLGQAVLLRRTVQHVQWTVLDVRRLLHQQSVQDQVRGRCTGRKERQNRHRNRGAGVVTHSQSS